MNAVAALSFLLLLFIVAVFWREALRARERANAIAIETCRRLNVQFLDGTVAFSAMRPARNPHGDWSWRRSYTFDYTDDGMRRHQGFVVLLGNAIEAVGLAPEGGHVH